MRVVVLLTDAFETVGGIQTFNRCLVKAVDELAEKQGWEVTALALSGADTNELVESYITPGKTQYRGFSGRSALFAVSALREAARADITIFGHIHFAPLIHALRAIRPRGRSYLMIYGLDVAKRLPFLHRSGASLMTKIISISAFTAGQMQGWSRLSPYHFALLPCALDPHYGKDVCLRSRRELGLPDGKMILAVSRLDARERYKGVDTVIRAMPKVLSRVPNASYVVVGDGTDRSRLQSLADALSVADHVHFAGYVADGLLPAYYQQCDVFALPSSGEGFGIVFLEAMRFGKPCIGARAGAIPEVVADGVTGFLVDPGDAAGLAEDTICLFRDADLCARMGSAGKALLDREFRFEVFCKRLEMILCTPMAD